jgi:hypothetical protein
MIRRLIVAACSLTVLMPMGWCCWLLPVAQAETATSVCHSCCSQQKATPTPAKPKETPRPAPCECKPLAADLALPKDSDAPMPMLIVMDGVELVHVTLAKACVPPISQLDWSPPLNLLHCVWLC